MEVTHRKEGGTHRGLADHSPVRGPGSRLLLEPGRLSMMQYAASPTSPATVAPGTHPALEANAIPRRSPSLAERAHHRQPGAECHWSPRVRLQSDLVQPMRPLRNPERQVEAEDGQGREPLRGCDRQVCGAARKRACGRARGPNASSATNPGQHRPQYSLGNGSLWGPDGALNPETPLDTRLPKGKSQWSMQVAMKPQTEASQSIRLRGRSHWVGTARRLGPGPPLASTAGNRLSPPRTLLPVTNKGLHFPGCIRGLPTANHCRGRAGGSIGLGCLRPS